MLDKAASTDHEPERDAFFAKAQALITRHHIEDSELNRASSKMEEHVVDVEGWGNAIRGVIRLYSGVGEINQCSVAHQTGRGYSRLIIWGSEIDAKLTCTLVDYLLPQLRADILRDRPRSRMSYSIGWANEVYERLADAQIAEAASSNALVPTNAEADSALRATYKLRTSRTTEVRPEEFDQGANAGGSADIGMTKLGDVGPAELGA